MRRDDAVYVGHMADAARKAVAMVAEVDRHEFDSNEILRLALAHLIQNVGEAARLVSPAFRDGHPDVPWKQVIGMRHRVVHDYMAVDYDIVWNVVKMELPPLIPVLEKAVS